jgi:hypothetical protein
MDGYVRAGQWFLQAVEPSPHSRSWLYTVGLVENFGHPELVVTDCEPIAAAGLVNEIAGRISRGAHVAPGGALDLDGYLVEFGVVHESYLAHGLCASWHGFYDWRGAPPGRLRVLQVIQPLTEWCDHCDRERRCLSIPGARGFGGPVVSRACARRL